MMERDDRLYLIHIQECIARIVQNDVSSLKHAIEAMLHYLG